MKPVKSWERNVAAVIDVPSEQMVPAIRDQESKNIDVKVAESGMRHRFTINPETRFNDLRQKLSLSMDYTFLAEGSLQPLDERQAVFVQVTNGGTVVAASRVDVGTEAHTPMLLRWLKTILSGSFLDRFLQVRAAPVQEQPLWQQRGWRDLGGMYSGSYVARGKRWQGSAEVRPSGDVWMFIYNPPSELFKHEKGLCFIKMGGSVYQMHTNRKITDVSAGIAACEEILHECVA